MLVISDVSQPTVWPLGSNFLPAENFTTASLLLSEFKTSEEGSAVSLRDMKKYASPYVW